MTRERRAAPFVGRVAELDVLGAALHQALEGVPGIVLLSGDAGVGKTRLVGELLNQAKRAGATVLLGASHEDLSVPYLPIASALRPMLASPLQPVDRESLARLVDPGTATSRTDGPDADGRLGLFLAVDDALAVQAATGPVVLALDDLHWADDASLDLVAHLATTIAHEATFAGRPILLVLTHRHVDRHDRLARVLERIEREPATIALTLTGLDELEVNELVTMLGPARPSRRLLHAIVEATEGNPLLVRGVVATVLREGASVEGGELQGPSTLAVRGASLLDAEIRTRIDAVDPDCRELLTVAAFLGDGGRLTELAAVLGDAPPALGARLDLASDAQLLHDDGERYHFDHPQVRQVLYHLPRARERAELHGHIADALERHHGDDADRYALPIAHHLSRSGPTADRERLIRWSRLAGDHAWAVAAWAEAGRCYDVAVDALGDPGPDRWTETADLHLRAGWADFHNFDLASADRHLETVVALAREHRDLRRWGEALLPLLRFRAGHAVEVGQQPDLSSLEEMIAAAGDEVPDLRALLRGLQAEISVNGRDPELGRHAIAAARAALGDQQDPWIASHVHFAEGLVAFAQLDLGAARTAFDKSTEHAARSADVWRQRTAMGRLPLVSWIEGDLPRAVREAEAAWTHNQRWNLRGELSYCTAQLTGLAVAQSRFADAERSGAEASLLHRRTGYVLAPGLVHPALALARIARGDVAGAQEALDAWEALGTRSVWRFRRAVDCLAGDVEPVAREIAARPWPELAVDPDLFLLPSAAAQVEVAWSIGDADLAQRAGEQLRRSWERGARWTTGWSASIARLLGTVATLDGDRRLASEWFAVARSDAGRAVAPGEAARVDLDEATALLRTPSVDSARAHALFDRASEAFDRLGMLGFLVAAHRLSGRSPVTSPTESTTGLRVILFTDIVGSTEMNVRAGDREYVAVLREHNRIVRDRLRRHDGVEFKHTGDGLCAWFTSAAAAVRCAVSIRDDLDRYSAVHPELPITVRIGLAAGEPIGEGGDLFGLAVVAAGRICSAADAGRVLVSEEIPRLVHGSTLRFAPIGEVALKGFPEPFRLHEALALA